MSISITWPFGPCGPLPPPQPAAPTSAAANRSLVRNASIAAESIATAPSTLEIDAGWLPLQVERHREAIVRDVRVDRVVQQDSLVLVLRIQPDAHEGQASEQRLQVLQIGAVGAEQTLELRGRKQTLMVGDIEDGGGVLVSRASVLDNRSASRTIERLQILWRLRKIAEVGCRQLLSVDREVEVHTAPGERDRRVPEPRRGRIDRSKERMDDVVHV